MDKVCKLITPSAWNSINIPKSDWSVNRKRFIPALPNLQYSTIITETHTISITI
jgi:hypothetical protein